MIPPNDHREEPYGPARPSVLSVSSCKKTGAILTFFALLYAALVISHWNRGYLDFGDGNYMYISWRISEGAMLYRDVLAPQPPMHLLVGAGIAKLATVLHLPHPLWAFRTFSLLLHIATMLLVYKTTVRITDGPQSTTPTHRARIAGLSASAIYLLLPIGFWWTLGYQSQPLLVFFLLLTFYLQLNGCLRCATASGVTGALAALTNMTTAPYLVLLAGWNLVRRPRLFLPFIIPLAVIVGLVITSAELLTHAYLDNVIRNQVGAFPRKELMPPGQNAITYAIDKLYREGGEVLRMEAGYLVLACLGMAFYARRAPGSVRELALVFCMASLGGIIYVAKGGTENYVFSIAEPYVALMAGYFISWIWHDAKPHLRDSRWADLSPALGAIAILLAIFCTTWIGLTHSWRTLNQGTYELPEHETVRIAEQIQANCPPNGLILAPPYYAFLAQRHVAMDYCELFLWRLKYLNESVDHQDGKAHQVARKLAALINDKKINYMVLDLDQTYLIPEIKAAVDANYTPQLEKPYRTLNTPLMIYKPK